MFRYLGKNGLKKAISVFSLYKELVLLALKKQVKKKFRKNQQNHPKRSLLSDFRNIMLENHFAAAFNFGQTTDEFWKFLLPWR